MQATIPTLIIVNLLAEFLPKLGISLGNDSLTAFAQALVAIVSGIWIYFHHKNVVAGLNGMQSQIKG